MKTYVLLVSIQLAASCLAGISRGDTWSDVVEVRRGSSLAVSYRAQLRGDWLVVEAAHQPNWHTYAMDNQWRAARALKGDEGLGSELPTEIKLGKGLEAIGSWYQTKPSDLSKPELRWYSWGFDDVSQFAVRVKTTGQPLAALSIRGQACDAKTCLTVNVSIPLRLDKAAPRSAEKLDPRKLVRVEKKAARNQ